MATRPTSAQPASGTLHLSSINRTSSGPGVPDTHPPWVQLYGHSVRISIGGLGLCKEQKPWPFRTLRSWDASTPASAQTSNASAVVFSEGPGAGFSPPEHSNPHSFWEEKGKEDSGREREEKEHSLRAFSEREVTCGFCAQQPSGPLRTGASPRPQLRGVQAGLAGPPAHLPFPAPSDVGRLLLFASVLR